MKKEIIKIVIALILFLVALIVPLQSQLINNGLFVISYLIVGLEIVLKAIRNIFKGKVFDENFLMAIATSIDALAVGVSFAALENVNIAFAATAICSITFMFSIVGVLIGKKFGNILNNKAQLVGGLILVGIGVKIFVEHTFF